MRHITDEQVAGHLDYRAVGEVLAQAFHDLGQGRAAIHGRQRSESEGLKLSSMGALWPARGVAGLKAYPTVNGQFSFAVLLFDLARNAPLALLDGHELTRLRTAAMTALVAARAVGHPPRKLALFGAGLQGRSQLQALQQVFDFEEVCVVDPAMTADLCAPLAGGTKARMRLASAEEAVRDADLVVTATRSAQPVFRGEWLSPGTFVAAMGTSTPAHRELDDTTLSRAARVIVEWKPQSLAEAGEIVLWNARPEAASERFVDLPQLLRGEAPWHAGAGGITVFKSVGVGLSDVATAWLAWQRVTAREPA